MSSKLLSNFLWRRAVKRFSPPTRSIDESSVIGVTKLPHVDGIDILPILEAARLAPTANGVQPFNIHVVVSHIMKDRLREVSYGQPQVSRLISTKLDCTG
jgi:nitroreductase